MTCALSIGASAAYSEDCADELSSIGLFKGGDSGYELDESPTRIQMAVMMVRLIGMEKYTQSYKLVCPFDDTPDWAVGYLGILSYHELVAGTSKTSYSPNDPCTPEMYATVLLRALGYSEKYGDFSYGGAVDFALEKGVIDYISWDDGFTRADMVIMSYSALFAPMADGSYDTLLAKLADEGAVNPEAAAGVYEKYSDKLTLRSYLSYNISDVMHAGGAVGGKQLTNSLEAINSSYNNGYYYLEIDFSWTKDNELVCAHDWNPELFPKYNKFPLTLSQFKNSKIYGVYTPMTLNTLAEWLREHPEAYIVTDVKEDNLAALAKIAARYPELLSRFIPQIYSKDEYPLVREMGYDNIILTLYKMDYADVINTSSLAAYSRQNRLLAITFEQSLATSKYISALSSSFARLYVHTVDDKELEAALRSYGIHAVYRNYT